MVLEALTSELFQLAEEPLDQVALPIEGGVDPALDPAIALGGDVTATTPGGDQVQDGPGVVPAVGDHIAGRGVRREERGDRRLVRRLPRREGDGHRQPAPVDHRVDLGAQSATRTTERVIRPPFRVAACWCARMIELSIRSMLSGDRSARVSKTRTQTPALDHRLSELLPVAWTAG